MTHDRRPLYDPIPPRRPNRGPALALSVVSLVIAAIVLLLVLSPVFL